MPTPALLQLLGLIESLNATVTILSDRVAALERAACPLDASSEGRTEVRRSH